MKPRSFLLVLMMGYLLVAGIGSATAADEDPYIEIIEISGNLDRHAIHFVTTRIDAAAASGATAAIIQLDSRATLSENVHHLAARMADPPLPVVVWIGPQPASALGGAFHLLAAAPIKAAAPGVEIGYADPVVAGSSSTMGQGHPLHEYANHKVTVDQPIEGLVDIVAPSISNLLVELEDRRVSVRGVRTPIDTVREVEGATVAVETVFYEPGVLVRLLRIATDAEAAFFFLMIGLSVAVFEYYALGPGIGAAVATLSLLIGGYGLTVLPLRGWALVVALLGIWLLTADFQRGRSGLLTVAGAISMMLGGLFFTDADPQITMSWVTMLVIVASVTAFFVVGMKTVARARFTTPTVGREYLIGKAGIAVTDFTPDGVVEVDGARWKATAHREAHLGSSDPVVIRGVEGPILEVDPLPEPLPGPRSNPATRAKKPSGSQHTPS